MKPRTSFAAVGAAGVLALTGVGVAAAGQNMILSSDTTTASASSSSDPASPSASASASASASSGKDITLPAGSVLATRVTQFCSRSDDVIARLEKRQAAIAKNGGKAKDKVEKRVAKLKEHNYPDRAARLQKRLDRAAARAKNLPDRLTNVKKAADECGDLGLK